AAGGFFTYHLLVVADAFAGKPRGKGSLRGRHVIDYVVLGLVCISLVGFYTTAYRGSAPWAGLASKIFAPLANPPLVGAAPGQVPSLPEWTGTERLNVLLLGIDSRGDSSQTQNTDTMIVLSLDPVNKTAAMLSIPRDVYIDRPGVFTDKINAAYAFGGYDLTRRVVEDLLGIRLTAYALVDFDSFTKIVDTVGGFLRSLPALVDRVGSTVETNFDPANIIPLAQFGSGIDGSAIRSEVLYPCGGAYPHCELQASSGDNGFILIPDRAKIRDFA